MKRLLIGGAIALGLISAFVWLATYSFIAVNVTDYNVSGEFSYTITATNNSSHTYTNTSATFRKIVRRGEYQVTVRQNESSAIANIKTRPFLKTSVVSAELTGEGHREFVGDNPGPCMYYLNTALISGMCNQYASELKEHVPATASSPTFTVRPPTNQLTGVSRGIATTQSGEHIMLAYNNIDGIRNHRLQLVRSDLSAVQSRIIKVADDTALYTIASYGAGVMVYDSEYRDIVYFSSMAAEPVKIVIEKPQNSSLRPRYFSVQQNNIVLLYSNVDSDELDSETSGQTAPGSLEGKTEVVVYRLDGTQQHIAFDHFSSSAIPCGNNKLCVFDSIGMVVYDIASKEAPPLYSVPKISSAFDTKNGLLLITNSDMILWGADEQKGFIEYSFGTYRYCGLQPTANGYVLCLIDNFNTKRALYIDQQSKNQDSIDKKISSLAATAEITSVSIYRNVIFLVPDYGDLMYDATQEGYAYDPRHVKTVDAAIAQIIKQSGIDQQTYKIINSGSVH